MSSCLRPSSAMCLRSALAAAGVLGTLLACGGMGDSKGTLSPNDLRPPVPTTTLSGRSAKGILQNATVTASEWGSGSWIKRGEGRTDGKGDFTVLLYGYQGKPVKLEVTGTQMVWDGPSGNGLLFGSSATLTEPFSLKTVVPSVTGGSRTEIPVTPYTTMATALFEAGSARDAAAAQKALSTLNVLTGFDVATTRVVDATDANAMVAASMPERRAAGMSAAVAFIPGKSVRSAVEGLAKSIEDGSFDSRDPVPIASLTQAWMAASGHPVLETRLGEGAAGELRVQAQTVNEASRTGTYTPVPPTAVSGGEVAQAKALIQDTRSLVSNILQSGYETPLGQAGREYQAVGDVFGRSATAITEILNLAILCGAREAGSIEAIRQEFAANGQVQRFVTVKDGASTLGTLILTLTDRSSVKIAVKGALKGSARTVDVDVTLDTGVDYTQLDWIHWTTRQSGLRLSLQAVVGDGTTVLEIPKGEVNLAWERKPDGSPLLNKLDLSNLTLALRTARASFQGGASIECVRMLDTTPVVDAFHDMDRLSPKKVHLEGAFQLGDRTLRATVGVDLANAETFDVLAFMEGYSTVSTILRPALTLKQVQDMKVILGMPINQDCFFHFYSSPDSRADHSHAGPYSEATVKALMSVFSPVKALLDRYQNLPGTRVNHVYTSVYQHGSILQCTIWGRLKLGHLLNTETADHFLQCTANVGFELSGVAGLPTLKAQVSARRSTLEGGTAVFGLSWGNRSYTFTFENLNVPKKNGTLTISNAQGASLQLRDIAGISSDNATGAIYVGSVKAADVRQFRNLVKVTYADGTFETLQ